MKNNKLKVDKVELLEKGIFYCWLFSIVFCWILILNDIKIIEEEFIFSPSVDGNPVLNEILIKIKHVLVSSMDFFMRTCIGLCTVVALKECCSRIKNSKKFSSFY